MQYCHQDHVTKLPPEADVLGGNEISPVEIFYKKNHYLGIQGHPEFSAGVVEAILNSKEEGGLIPKEQINEAMKTLNTANDADWVSRLMVGFITKSTL